MNNTWQSWHGVIYPNGTPQFPNAAVSGTLPSYQSVTSTPVTYTGDAPQSRRPARLFVLACVRFSGVTYHVRRLGDSGDWWPQAENSPDVSKAKVFDATSIGDCQEAIDLILKHEYQVFAA